MRSTPLHIATLFLLFFSMEALQAQSEHEVEKGETLFSIGQQYDVSVQELRKANELDDTDEIEPGQILRIPSASSNTQDTIEHRVEEGETLYSICQQYQAGIDEVLQLNPEAKKEVKFGQVLRIPVGNKSPSGTGEGLPFDTTDSGFHYHRVEKGQTLFSLSREYGTDIERLRELNPQLEEELEQEQLLRFPKEGKSQEKGSEKTMELPDRLKREGYLIIRVKKGQTLYSLSREHGLSVEELREANPHLEGELAAEQELRIPAAEGVEGKRTRKKKDAPFLPRAMSDTIVIHTVEKGESIRSIATMYGTDPLLIILTNELFFKDIKEGEVLLIPIPEKKEDELPPGSELKEKYRVTLLLPLYPEANDTILKGSFDETPKLHGPSEFALEFYEGFRIAADSVAAKGGSFEVHTISTRKGQKNLEELLREKEVRKSDLVVGPFYKENLKNAAKTLKGSGVHIACPVRHSNKILLEGPNISKVIPSRITLLKQLAEHVAVEHGHQNVIMLSSGKEKEERLERIFSERFNRFLDQNEEKYRDSLKAVGIDKLKGMLKKDTLNILCVPGEDKIFASRLMNRVSKMNDDVGGSSYRIRIYASEAWKEFETIDIKRKERYALHVATGRHILHDSLPAQHFYHAYRERNHTDPGKYGFLGYDVGLFYLSALSRYGTSFPERFGQVEVPTLHLGVDLYRTGVRSGYENRHSYIIRYTEDHRIERIPLRKEEEK